MVDPSKFVPLRVSGFYLFFGFAWILISDISMVWTGFVDIPAYFFSLSKGLLFVGVSSIIIYVLMRQQLKRVSRANSLAHAVINGTTDAVFVKDRSGRYLMFNTAGGLLVNKRAEDVIGQDDHFVFDAQSAAALRDRDQRIMESGVADTAEEVLTIDNWTRVYSATKVPYRDESGNVIGLIGISRDITDQRRLEEHFRQSQKMEAVGRLAGGVAHDFNNLLTVINGYCHMLVEQISEPSDTRDSLHAIQDAADRATRLTRQLLSFSRKAMIELKVLDLNQVIVQTSALMRRLVGHDVSVELVLAPTACFIEADPIQIDQVILNLTVNARDASDKGSVVTIATRSVEFTSVQQTTTGVLRPGKYIELTVSDQGDGIPDSVKTQIFEPFFSTKEREKGTGLGLSVVHGIVSQTGGQIDVESAPGHGASFRIYFKEVSRQVSNVPSSSLAIEAGRERILLVEDEQSIRMLCERALSAHGYQVLAAASGSEALELFTQSSDRIDMLVTDLMMPSMSGRELADELRLKKPGLLVLYISGYSDDLSIQEGVHSGLDTLLQKPFLPGDLARKVREVLDGPDHEFAPQDDCMSPS